MNFNFTDEQRILRASLRRFLADRCPFERRRETSQGADGLLPGIWTAMANELGILGAGFAEDLGGSGGGPIEHMIIMEELGRALVREPYLESIVIGAEILSRSETSASTRAFEAVLSGAQRLAYAWEEPGMGMDLTRIETVAKAGADGWTLTGRKIFVAAAPWAGQLIVAARTSGAAGDNVGISLFLVETEQTGVSRDDYSTIDGRQCSDIQLESVAVSHDALLATEGGALPLLGEINDRAIAALCAEAIGAMDFLLEATMAYTKERCQFGKTLSSFQVLQHRMADMLIELELATSAVYLTTLTLSAPAPERARAASAAKSMIGAAGRFVGQNAVQLHGAMGMTDDVAIGHYFKRLMAISAQFGDADHHRTRYEALSRRSDNSA
jgi:alkylation response protein AidB-like acyl-CoA dehydrogenase